MRRVGIPLANEVDHHLFSALIKRVDLVVGSEYLFGAIAVGVSEALERSLDHVGDLARRVAISASIADAASWGIWVARYATSRDFESMCAKSLTRRNDPET